MSMSQTATPINPRLAAGFTLLEVLVAVVVLSIGLLGLAGLQMTALRNNTSAYMRSQATFLANDLADRVRANSAANYVSASANQHGGACLDNAVGCTPTQMAEYDIWEWQNSISSLLPSGSGIICVDGDGAITDGSPGADGCSGTSPDLTIKIWWDDDRNGSADQLFAMSFQP